MDIDDVLYRQIDALLRPLLSARSRAMRLAVGEDDLLQECLLRAFKGPRTALEESEWKQLALWVLKDAYRKQRRSRGAEEAYYASSSQEADPSFDEELEGASWEAKKLVRMLRNGYSLAESAEACGLSRYRALRVLSSFRKELSS